MKADDMATPCIVKVARIETGYLVRVEGSGTSAESPTLAGFMTQCLEQDPDAAIVVDICGCDHLDSTFLGCLLASHLRCKELGRNELLVVADDKIRQRLLSSNKLDAILKLAEAAPPPLGEFVRLNARKLDSHEFGRHVMESHRALARVPSPNARIFQEIADQLERELEDKRRFSDKPSSIAETL